MNELSPSSEPASQPLVIGKRIPLIEPQKKPMRWLLTAAYVHAGIVLPVICFALACNGSPLGPEWQSGNWNDFIELLLGGSPTWPFYPFLIYSMACMALLVFRAERFAHRFMVRLGIYTGIILSLQYSFVMGFSLRSPSGFQDPQLLYDIVIFLIVVIAGPGLLWLIRKMASRYGEHMVGMAALGILVIAVLLSAGYSGFTHGGTSLVMIVVIFQLAAAPALAFSAYGMMGINLWRSEFPQQERDILKTILPLAWLGGYLGAWRLAWLAVLAEYAKLPTSPPDCYVSTAAAKGHCWLVQSTAWKLSGRVIIINQQMKVLKAFEGILCEACPRLHRLIRTIYNRWGPVLARRITHPLAADCAYLCLKPLEWGAAAVVAIRATVRIIK